MDKYKIAIIDDLSSIQVMIIAMNFKRSSVSTFTDVLSFLSIHEKISFDLIVSDVNMPIMNGIELYYELKRRQDQTPIILCTSGRFLNYRSEVDCEIIERPIKSENLLQAVAKFLDIDRI